MNALNEYDRFFAIYPMYQKYQSVKAFKNLHDFLWKPESIEKMQDAIKFGRPAIEGIVLDIEELYFDKSDFTFEDDFAKKATGMLIKYILEYFGFISSKQRNISKGKGAKYFTSGMHYEFDSSKESLRLETVLSIVAVQK
ncbi:hypothetical protein PZE06_21355 [Robertmurraya sp. DFI.2.37]|uniref:hypothetical protein n=1 Tax=Robertmurraya sp. DFI.2.37 TaxID=3031819 RepID=UPI001248F5A8|nr:hypothetical protein [Robertmurraya sp. DFI.2.37]MDF1510686.1 hypothetical protein [Robertmurraya sp. DFI.2.37]